MKFSNCLTIPRALLCLSLVLACSPKSSGQLIGKGGFNQAGVLNYVPPKKVVAKPGAVVDSVLPVELRPGYHVNSNTPSDDYLIPLRLTWDAGPLENSVVVEGLTSVLIGINKKYGSTHAGIRITGAANK